jgi:hypothetical protein
MKFTVGNKPHTECRSHQEEADIADKALAGDLKRADQGHGP